MSDTAHHFKLHQYFYDEKDKKVYYILEKEECHKNGHNIKFLVQDFENFKHLRKSYSHDHHLRFVDVSTKHYVLSHLRKEEDHLYLELLDSRMNPRSDLYLDDQILIEQVTKVLDASSLAAQESFKKAYRNINDLYFDCKTLTVKVVHITVNPMHRINKVIEIEKIVQITGVDFSHLHDHHHQHHH